MASLEETRADAFARLRDKMEQGQVDPEDSGALKEVIRNFDQCHNKVVGFVEARTLPNLIGQLNNMTTLSRRMEDTLSRTSRRLINALRQVEQ